MIIVKEGVSCETDRKLLWDPKQRPEAQISAGLKGWFLGIYLAYLVAGIAAMGSAIYFLLTPNQRRSSLISSFQLYSKFPPTSPLIISFGGDRYDDDSK